MPEATTQIVLQGDLATPVEVRGSGTPVLYLRAEEAWSEDPVLDALAKDFVVYAPVLAGTEQSLTQLDSIHDLLIYTNDLLDALELGPLPVIGHSFGGMVAAELAAMNPQRVTHLVVIAPLGLWNDDEPVSELQALDSVVLAQRLFGDADSPSAQTWLQASQTTGTFERMQSLRAAYHFLFPIPERGLAKRLHRVKCPTLILWGDKDGITPPSYAAAFQRLIPGSQVQQLASAGHMLNDQQAAQAAAAIDTFLTNNGKR
jgi:pimeloyl-ACP methyl ester carboxylesterase